MDFNLISNIESCYIVLPHLLYFSHIPTAIIAFALGFFVYFKNKSSLTSKILLFISLTFSLWSVIDLSLWVTSDSRKVMFFWSIINLLEMLVSSSTLYFSYVFLEKKDAPFKYKTIIGALLTIFIVLIPTQLNLPGFDVLSCNAEQGYLTYYFYFLEILFFFWLATYLIKKIATSKKADRARITYFSIGAICFLASFSGANVIASITEHWEILQYGLFGMPFFMAFLVYLIVKYNAFNIKIFGAEALVTAIIVLTGSQLFFVQNPTNRILTIISLTLITAFGWLLVRSVTREARQREQLNKYAIDMVKTNAELQDAYAKLETLDKAKSEFISIASHQLRTPLTAIKGYVSLMIEGDYGKISKEAMQSMKNVYLANERLVKLVNSLLDMSRIEAGRVTLDFSPVKVDDLVADILRELRAEAENKNLKLRIDKDRATLPKIEADSAKLRDALMNLVDNAIKYTNKGEVVVKIKYDSFRGDMEIIVQDTGEGMSQEEIDKLFQSFSRADSGKKNWAEGSGLGLYIAKKFVEMHHGNIRAESPGKGHGSRFIVELPVAQPSTPQSQ